MRQKRYLYGRRGGRIKSLARREALEVLPERWFLSLPETPVSSLSDLCGMAYSRWAMEIGFGNGQHLLARAALEPDCGFIGIEPFRKGIGNVVDALEEGRVNNIRIFSDAAQLLLPLLPPQSLHHLYILFPDPWPKARHHKRRLVTPDFCRQAKDLLSDDGQLCMASDDASYQEQMLESALLAGWEWTAERSTSWQQPFTPGLVTEYQRRGERAGRKAAFLEFRQGSD